LYLVDVETYKISLSTLTKLNWKFYHYGPYAFEIDEALKQLELEIPQEDVITSSGHKAKIFKPSRYLYSSFEKSTGYEKMLVDRVLDTWGSEDLNVLLNYVYFHTEPMQNAERGATLDFSSIRRTTQTIAKFVKINVDPKVQQLLRQKFIDISKNRGKQNILTPKPRFDEVFTSSFIKICSEEHYTVRPGEIVINQDTKIDIRRQSEQE
jgi:sulfur relay (sulfurtransferase) DsrC/TusE family protein